MGSQQFCLRWNNHQSNMLAVFDQLLQSEAFVDVTLACEGLSVKAHKMVLSACSPYFQSLFMDNPCQHPIVILKDMRYSELKAIIDFMYKGEVNVSQDQLSNLLKTAEALKVKGLAEVTGAANGVPEDTLIQPGGPDLPTLKHLIRSQTGGGTTVTESHPNNNGNNQSTNDGGRVSPPSKRKRGRPRKRSSSDGGHDSTEMLESLVDIQQDDSMSPLPSQQSHASAKDQNDDDDANSLIISEEHSPDYDDGSQEGIATCDIKMEALTPEGQPLCLDEPNQSGSGSIPPSLPSTSQDLFFKRKRWTERQMQMAVEAVRTGTMSIKLAGQMFGIPTMTVWSRTRKLGISSSYGRKVSESNGGDFGSGGSGNEVMTHHRRSSINDLIR